MSIIAIALENAKDRKLMSELLAENHTVAEIGLDGALHREFDLCIVGTHMLPLIAEQIRARKEAEQPVFLPFLLAASRQDAKMIGNRLWETVDELVTVPVEKRELLARVEVLLRIRRLSMDMLRSNDDLQEFAYVASHDLREPLRMVESYVELLARRYKGKLDADADDFIGYAVDGVHRMNALIEDLLDYSRIGTRGMPPKPVLLGDALNGAIENLRVAIDESGAEITSEDLPEVEADELQMIRLLQNLIGNAIKFRLDEPPRVHVSAEKTGDQWVISVSDNGMGIAPEHHERIFHLFERLSSREDRSGTGIGLAVCKKIVERHGGRIWLESELGKGTTFYFSLLGS